MRALSTLIVCVAMISAVLWLAAGRSNASVNICWRLLEPIWIPPTPQDAGECAEANLYLCAIGLLHCCGPTCRLHPECNLGGTFVDGHWEDITCELMEPEEAFDRFLRSHLRPLDDGIPIIRRVATAHIESLSLQARALPMDLQNLVNGILASSEAARLPSFAPLHVESALLLPDRVGEAALYLPASRTRAITLDNLIIMRSMFFYPLFNNVAPPLMSLRIFCAAPRAYRDALSLLLHELVHVRQWDELGRDTFLNTYLIEVLVFGYGNDSFEREAFALAHGTPPSTVDQRFRNCDPMVGLIPIFL